MKILELRKKFAALVEQYRAAQNESAPDLTKLENLSAEMRSLSAQIETEDAILRTQTGVDPYSSSGEATPPTSQVSKSETRAAVDRYMRTGDSAELRAMTSGTGTGGDTGGYLIPEEWEKQILEKERELFVMRQLADVQSSETTVNIPVAVETGASSWIDEAAAYPESDAKFDNIQMTAHKVGRICKVSEELLLDNQYNLEGWLTGAFGYSNGLAMETAFISGDGTKKPTGFLVNAEAVAASAGVALKYEDILKMFGELKSGYYNNAVWLMNGSTLIELMKLKDKAGKYLYSPFDPKTSTEPMGQMLGKKIVISSLMPDIGAGKKPVAFGDFKKYRIHDRNGFSILRMNETYAANGMVGFRGMQRTDGKLLLPEAVKVLTFAGSGG